MCIFYELAIPLLGVYPRDNLAYVLLQTWNHNFPSSPVNNSKTLETTQIPINNGKNSSCVRATSLQWCSTLCNPIDCSPPRCLSMGFSRQEYWSGQPCPPPGDLSHPGIKPMSLMYPALAGCFFITIANWEAQDCRHMCQTGWILKA